MINNKGFTILEVILMIVVVVVVSAASFIGYNNIQNAKKSNAQQSTTSDQKKLPADGLAKEEKISPTETIREKDTSHSTYINSKLGYMFDFPKEWKIHADITGDYVGIITLTSPGFEEIKYENGNADTLKGAVVTIEPMSSYSGSSPIQFDGLEGALYKNGVFNPVITTVGKYQAVEYAYANEAPQTTYIRLLFGGQGNFIPTSFQSEGDESTSSYYPIYKEILASVH